ncbi:MAG: hypothetical protein Q7O66_12605 [Dehalococcoidia bacterium]|nr:hypothetical protein [Dehalococcoidia bacterium]
MLPGTVVLGDHNGEQDHTNMSFNRFLALVDEDALLRVALGIIETIAKTEGRVLWH